MALFVSQIFLLVQHILPKRLMTSLVYRLTHVRLAVIKNTLIRGFLKFYTVNLDEVKKAVPDDFDCFNDFFIRELKGGSRPIDAAADSVVSPADGFVSALGTIEKNSMLQAKGYEYNLEELLVTDLHEARTFYDGSFACIYLAPFNYHRVHAPVAGELIAARFVPGTLFSVNPTSVSHLRGLFVRNERLICHFKTASGPCVLILVGALNVGSITTRWTGELRPRRGSVVEDIDLTRSPEPTTVGKGDLLGWFNMGSTVILLSPPEICEWQSGLETGDPVRMGEPIGRIAI